jgi:tetratricopeptide (TPR) repeat protein
MQCVTLGELGTAYQFLNMHNESELAHRDRVQLAMKWSLEREEANARPNQANEGDSDTDQDSHDCEDSPNGSKRKSKPIMLPKEKDTNSALLAMQYGVGSALAGIGNALRAQGKNLDALKIYGEHLRFGFAMGHPDEITCALANRGSLLLGLDRIPEALEHFSQEQAFYLSELKATSGKKTFIGVETPIEARRRNNLRRAFDGFEKIATVHLATDDMVGLEMALKDWACLAQETGEKLEEATALEHLVEFKITRASENNANPAALRRLVREITIGDKTGTQMELSSLSQGRGPQFTSPLESPKFKQLAALCRCPSKKIPPTLEDSVQALELCGRYIEILEQLGQLQKASECQRSVEDILHSIGFK